ncbi:hypothetical protein AKG98_1204 [Moritella sp. JT01]|nr:hypothetical protein AKG98_1204 [Moritella sp. JT01]
MCHVDFGTPVTNQVSIELTYTYLKCYIGSTFILAIQLNHSDLYNCVNIELMPFFIL